MHDTKKSLTGWQLEELYRESLATLPYPDLEPTGGVQGEFEPNPGEGFVEYSEEYVFCAGKLLDEPLMAGGWVDLRSEAGEVYITALFSVARNGDWQNKAAQVLPEYHAIQGTYDLDAKRWEFWIDAY